MKSISIGKILITLVATWAAFGSYIFDWNTTHIFNPNWPPHAKFHNAQTMLLGTMLGLYALYILWLQKGEKITIVKMSVALSGFYWLTQAGATLFPGTALVDPEFAHTGQAPVQLIVDIVMLLLLSIAYALEVKRIKAHP